MRLFIITTLLLACCSAQESTPPPPNRQLPLLDPSLGIVSGVEAAPAPDTTPVFKPKPIPPNRKRPVITKADIVMAMSDKLGILVDSLAQRLAADVEGVLVNLPADPAPPNSPTPGKKRSKEAQQSVEQSIEQSIQADSSDTSESASP